MVGHGTRAAHGVQGVTVSGRRAAAAVLLALVVPCAGFQAKTRLPDGIIVDFGCGVIVARNASTGESTLQVSTTRGSFPYGFADDGSAEDAAFKELLTKKPFLCRVGRRAGDPGSTGLASVAMVSLATNLDYLLFKHKKKHGNRMDILGALAAKDRYARQHHLPYYLWLGVLPAGRLRRVAGSDCNDTTNSTGHIYKALAMLAIFDDKPKLEWAVFVDMDTLPARPELSPDRYLKLAPEAHLVGGSNPTLPILLNSGLLFVRNSKWARDFLRTWWKLRCGYKDQYSLWKALFQTWAAEAEDARWRPHRHVFDSYDSARHFVLPKVLEEGALKTLRAPGARWACGDDSDCGRILRQTGCLIEPLHLRNVLLLPVTPFHDGATVFPPSISRDAAGPWRTDYWFCHAACELDHANPAADKYAPGRKRKEFEYGACRNDSSFHVFNCECGRVYQKYQAELL
mmetsp:Transcript_8652/g.26040  ORF Transcript_8652/g.26040 Transcript_8652/m.26040 type:complete len:457 (+) Transcript_8652:185-1555(+)